MLKCIIIFVLFFSSLINCFGATSKIRVMDLQKIMIEAPQSVALQAKVSRQFAPHQDDLRLMEKQFEKDFRNYLAVAPKMKRAKRHEMRLDLAKEYYKLQKAKEKLEKDLSHTMISMNDTMRKQIDNIAKDYARDNNIDLVLYKNCVMYNRKKFDINDEILSILSKGD